MGFTPPDGWERDSDKLFIHRTGVRIQLGTFGGKEGWYIVPTDLDAPVVPFAATPEGRDQAFAAFAKAKGSFTAKAAKAKAAKEEPEAEAEAEEDDEEETEKEGDDEDR